MSCLLPPLPPSSPLLLVQKKQVDLSSVPSSWTLTFSGSPSLVAGTRTRVRLCCLGQVLDASGCRQAPFLWCNDSACLMYLYEDQGNKRDDAYKMPGTQEALPHCLLPLLPTAARVLSPEYPSVLFFFSLFTNPRKTFVLI